MHAMQETRFALSVIGRVTLVDTANLVLNEGPTTVVRAVDLNKQTSDISDKYPNGRMSVVIHRANIHYSTDKRIKN